MSDITETQTAVDGRLLLCSLADFWSLLEPVLVSAKARNLCEIGMGKGEFTKKLIEYCREHAGAYTGIDPLAKSDSPGSSPKMTILSRPSLEALPELAAQDVYFLDGDHNYHTVGNELRLILETPGRWPLVILHDVCWPWGRRDQYCDPKTIPEAACHPHSTSLSVVPGRSELGAGGFSGDASDYAYAAASHEEGPRNGVLTAVEDFLRTPAGQGWRSLVIPAIFGLGILYAPAKVAVDTKSAIDQLEQSIGPLKRLLELMERNRVDLFLTYLRQTSELKSVHEEYRKLHAAYEDLAAHASGLLEKYNELQAHRDALQAANEKLQPKAKASKIR